MAVLETEVMLIVVQAMDLRDLNGVSTNLTAQGEAVVTHTRRRSKGPLTLRERKSSPGRTMRSREEARRNLILAEQTKQCEANSKQASKSMPSPRRTSASVSRLCLSDFLEGGLKERRGKGLGLGLEKNMRDETSGLS
jgi:hypothetical protein